MKNWIKWYLARAERQHISNLTEENADLVRQVVSVRAQRPCSIR